MNIIKNKSPEFKKIKFSCDGCLNPKLDQFPLIRDHLNKYNTTAFIGAMGSGKTSLVINLIKLFKKTFHKIIVFMPSYSRGSLDDKLFNKLPDEQLYDELNQANINEVYEICKEQSAEGLKTLIIYDDVQKALKDPGVLKSLNNLVANQRHLKICNYILLQNFYKLDKSLREIINNIVLFKVGKTQQTKIFTEIIELKKERFDEIQNTVYDKPYEWLFVNVSSQRIYKKFDEIELIDNN